MKRIATPEALGGRPIETPPGEMEQVDFGKYSTELDAFSAGQITCPVCESAYNHPVRIVTNRGGDITIVEHTRPARSVTGLPTGRGSSIWLEFWCEEGHRWQGGSDDGDYCRCPDGGTRDPYLWAQGLPTPTQICSRCGKENQVQIVYTDDWRGDRAMKSLGGLP
jgi:hypothetical protein